MKRIPLLLLACALLAGACSDTTEPLPPGPTNGSISTGPRSELGSTSIGPSGGRLAITSGALSGLTLEVPSGAFATPRSATVSAADITSHTYGSVIRPLAPLLRVSVGAEYAEAPMRLTVPITLPDGHFAMGFYYDEATGELEGIPVVSLTATSITLLTTHFLGTALSDGARQRIAGIANHADILIASVNEGELSGVFQTSFQPSVDDWEFENWGSYLATGGHCAGQSISAMWYHHAKRLREGHQPLFGRFDQGHDALLVDNPQGYRFASVVHDMINWGKRDAWWAVFEGGATGKLTLDQLHYYSFLYAIKVTKRPQYIAVRNATSGHALIVYKAGEGTLWVSDPNHPGDRTRVVTFRQNSTFEPYIIGATAKDPGIAMTDIYYCSKSSLVDHSRIPARFEQLVDGTAGSIPPHAFPAVRVEWHDGVQWVPIPDTIRTSADELTFRAVCLTCPFTYANMLVDLDQYNDQTKSVATSVAGVLTTKVNAGVNDVHLVVSGWPVAGERGYITYEHVVVKKQQQAMVYYWLKGAMKEKDTIHFGMKDASFTLPGTWKDATTFVIDLKDHMVTDPKTGQTLPVTAKMTFVATPDLSSLVSADVYFQLPFQGTNVVTANFTARNLPRTSNFPTESIYEVDGPSTCSHITRIDFTNALVRPIWWGCDDESYVRIRILK